MTGKRARSAAARRVGRLRRGYLTRGGGEGLARSARCGTIRGMRAMSQAKAQSQRDRQMHAWIGAPPECLAASRPAEVQQDRAAREVSRKAIQRTAGTRSRSIVHLRTKRPRPGGDCAAVASRASASLDR